MNNIDPQLQSILTSLLKDAVTGLGAFLVANGYLASNQEAAFTSYVVGLLVIVASQGITWWKQRQVAPKALIEAVNKGDNGVKVVPVSAPTPAVDAPQK